MKKSPPSSEWKPFELKLTKRFYGIIPPVNEMDDDVLYYSLNSNYPLVDMIYKSSDGCVTGIQVTRRDKGKRVIKHGPMEKFLKKINLENHKKLCLVLCPKPADAEEAELTFSDDVVEVNYEVNYEVWKIPPTYNQTYV